MSDALTATSRAFFERTKVKMMASIALGACALLMLGFCSSAGGFAASANQSKQMKTVVNSNDDHVTSSYISLAGGFGFASFLYIVGFFLLVAVAIYVSPVLCGSPKEKKMLSSPEELDTSYSAYTEHNVGHINPSGNNNNNNYNNNNMQSGVASPYVVPSSGPTASSGVSVV